MAESYSVTAILSAQDKNFSSVFGSAQNAADSLTQKLSSGLGFGVLVGIGQKAFSALTSAASGFTGELENTSAAWQTFEKNASMNGHLESEIASTKKELQSFAQQTIYSASDMATTYAQLDAVGIASAESLVKGFGGIAAAAENPAQAMKTLSQQGVQMAAKPKVAWQDFKLMLEQTPAGIAAVAKEMGMTTSEMVQAVQEGEIATQSFFEAVEKVGTSADFTDLATSYKTTGQALDGLSETVTNTLMPSFELFQGKAIGAVEKVIGFVESFDGQKIADTIGGVFEAFESGGAMGAASKVSDLLDRLPDSIKAAAAAVGTLGAVSITNSVLSSGVWRSGIKGIGIFRRSMSALPGAIGKNAKSIAKSIGGVGKGVLSILPSGAAGKITGAFGHIASRAAETGRVFKMVGGIMWDNFANNSIAGKVVTRVGKVLGGVTGVVTKVGGRMASGLQSMMGLALKALMPAAVIGAALVGLGVLYSKFGDQIDGILQMAQEKGPQFITGFVQGITERIPDLMASGAQLVSGLMSTVTANLPAIISGGVSIITSLVSGVASAAPGLIGKATELIGTFAVSVLSALPALITSGMQLLASVAQGVAANLPLLASYAMQAIMQFAQGMVSNLPTILSSAAQIVTSMVTGIVNMLPVLIQQGIQLITYLGQSILQNLPLIIQTGVQVIASLVAGVVQAIPMIVQGAVELLGQFIDTILNTDWIAVGGQIIDAIGNGIKAGFSAVGDIVVGLFSGDTSAEQAAAEQATKTAESTAQAYESSSSYIADAARQASEGGAKELVAGITESTVDFGNSMSDMAANGVSMFTESMSTLDLTGCGTEAADAITSEYDAGMAQIPEVTQKAGTQAVAALQKAGTKAVTIAKQTTTKVISALRSGIGAARSAGTALGMGFAAGIGAQQGSAASAGSGLKNAALSGMNGGYGTAYSLGVYIGQGLVNGLNSMLGAVRASANAIVSEANRAIEAKAKIGSPSKITTQYGEWIGQGLANGIRNKARNVVAQSKNLIKSLNKTMKAGASKLGTLSTRATGAIKAFRSALNSKVSTNLEWVDSYIKGLQNKLKDHKDVSASFSKSMSSLLKSYKESYKKQAENLISSVNTKLTKLAKTYETKYKDIINARSNFTEKLQDRTLYAADDYGNVELTDWTAKTKTLKAYQNNINRLKKLLPKNMMEDILAMDTANGLAYTNELLKRSEAQIKAYGKSYTAFKATGASIANKYYASQLKSVKNEYTAQLAAMQKSMSKQANKIGSNIAKGLINGMKSKSGALDSAGKTLADTVLKAIKKKLKIGSPSKVAKADGVYTGEGFIDGLESKIAETRRTMTNLLQPPDIITPTRGFSLNDDYSYSEEAQYTIYVESTLDGKKVGEGTAKYVQKANEAANRRENRKRGVRA